MGTPQYLSPEQAQGRPRPRPPTSTPSAWWPSSASPAAGRSSPRPPVATALAHLREPVPDLPRRRARPTWRPSSAGHWRSPPPRTVRRRHRARRRPARPGRRRRRPTGPRCLTGGGRRCPADAAAAARPARTGPAADRPRRRRRSPWAWILLRRLLSLVGHRGRAAGRLADESSPPRPRTRSDSPGDAGRPDRRAAHREPTVLRRPRPPRSRWTSPTTSAVTSRTSRPSCRTSGSRCEGEARQPRATRKRTPWPRSTPSGTSRRATPSR